jgi:hypothetical protein
MANVNGLIAPPAFKNPEVPYYLTDNVPVIPQPTLVAPITLQSEDGEGTALMTVSGFEDGAAYEYTGAISLRPGASSLGPASDGLTMRSVADGVSVEIGTDSQTVNTLSIAGPSGLAQVYDEVYKQPVALRDITIVGTNPVCAPTGGAEVFRGAQAAVAAAAPGVPPTVFNRIQVPRSGAYMLQTEIRMGNGAGANTVVLPSEVVGGVPIWYGLQVGMTEFGTVIVVPYSNFEVIGGDFQAVQTFETNGLTIRTYSVVVVLDATKVYTVGLVSGNAAWNIGSAGQIKIELIAMC